MTPRLLILAVVLALFLIALCHAPDLAHEPDVSRTKDTQVVTWGRVAPPYVVDSAMFVPPVRARARTAPTERTTMRAASVSAPVTRHRWPTGCTLGQSFDEGPCVPAQRPCAIPAYICARESQGRINVWNHAGSGASGKYQFLASTWAGYGGYPYAAWAPEDVQDARALELWNSAGGHRHWGAA